MVGIDYLRSMAARQWLQARAQEPVHRDDNVFALLFRLRVAERLGDVQAMTELLPRLVPWAAQLPAAGKLVEVVRETLQKLPATLPEAKGAAYGRALMDAGRIQEAWEYWQRQEHPSLAEERRVRLATLAWRLGEFEAAIDNLRAQGSESRLSRNSAEMIRRYEESLAEAGKVHAMEIHQLPLPAVRQLAARMREKPAAATPDLAALAQAWGEFSGDWSMAVSLLSEAEAAAIASPVLGARLAPLVSSKEFASAKVAPKALEALLAACRAAGAMAAVATLEARLASAVPAPSPALAPSAEPSKPAAETKLEMASVVAAILAKPPAPAPVEAKPAAPVAEADRAPADNAKAQSVPSKSKSAPAKPDGAPAAPAKPARAKAASASDKPKATAPGKPKPAAARRPGGK